MHPYPLVFGLSLVLAIILCIVFLLLLSDKSKIEAMGVGSIVLGLCFLMGFCWERTVDITHINDPITCELEFTDNDITITYDNQNLSIYEYMSINDIRLIEEGKHAVKIPSKTMVLENGETIDKVYKYEMYLYVKD